MKHIISFFLLILAQPLFGFHVGVGLGWNTIDETFNSDLFTNQEKSGRDRYEAVKK